MKISLSTEAWRYALLAVAVLQSAVNIAFFSCGVLIWGSVISSTGANTITIIGVIVLFVALGGCVVSMRDSYKQFFVLAGINISFIVIHFACLVGYAVNIGDIMVKLNERIDNAWSEEIQQPGPMRSIEVVNQCCGLKGPDDYLNRTLDLPESCCYAFNCAITENVFLRGCEEAAPDYINGLKAPFICSNLGLIFLAALGAYASNYLAKHIDIDDEKDTDIIINEA